MQHFKQQEQRDDEGNGYCLQKLPTALCTVQPLYTSPVEIHSQDCPIDAERISRELVHTTIHALPVTPDKISRIRGPALEVTKVDNKTADIKIIHGFRAHFGTPSKKGRFTNCLIQAPNDQLRARVMHRGSLSFSDLSELETGNSQAVEKRVKGEWEIDKNEIQLGRRIAVGGFAEVFIAEYQGTIVAVKRLFDRDATAIEQFKREVIILAKLRHPNLILFMGYCLSPEMCIVSEFMHKGCLFNVLREHDGHPLEPLYIETILVSVARGMAYLHSRDPPILHLDLKSPNILIDNAWRVKVTDFGLSRCRNRTLVSNNGGANGTPHWMSPECIRGERIDEKSDVYSYGVVIWELLTGRAPWERLNAIQVIATVGFKNNRLPTPDYPDQVLVDLMTSCCAEHPDDRPSFPEILDILDDHYRPKPKMPRIRVAPKQSASESTEPTSPAVGTIVEIFSGTDAPTTASSKPDDPDGTHQASRSDRQDSRLVDQSTPAETVKQGQGMETSTGPADVTAVEGAPALVENSTVGQIIKAGNDVMNPKRSVDRLESFEKILRSQKSADKSQRMVSPFAEYAETPLSDEVDERPIEATDMISDPEPSGETPRSTFEFSAFAAFAAVPFGDSGTSSGRPNSGEAIMGDVTAETVDASGLSMKTPKRRESDDMDGYPSLTPGGHGFNEVETHEGGYGHLGGKEGADEWRIKVADVEERDEGDQFSFCEEAVSHQLLDGHDVTPSEASWSDPSIDLHPHSTDDPPKRHGIPPMSFLPTSARSLHQ